VDLFEFLLELLKTSHQISKGIILVVVVVVVVVVGGGGGEGGREEW